MLPELSARAMDVIKPEVVNRTHGRSLAARPPRAVEREWEATTWRAVGALRRIECGEVVAARTIEATGKLLHQASRQWADNPVGTEVLREVVEAVAQIGVTLTAQVMLGGRR